MGKAISSSAIPAAAITINDRVMDMVGLPKRGFENVFLASEQHSGQHVITNQNHPLICVAVKANIEYILEHSLVERSKELGAYLLEKLIRLESRFKQLKRARGKGLQAGIEVTHIENPRKGDEQLAAKICSEMFKKGFIIYSTFNRVRDMALIGFSPPLIITKEDIDLSMDAFEKTVEELIG
jgi:4-aminobutyrate aminotransferase-like enzyme